MWSLEAFSNSLSKTKLTVPGTSRTTLDLEELHGQYFRPAWTAWGTTPAIWLRFTPGPDLTHMLLCTWGSFLAYHAPGRLWTQDPSWVLLSGTIFQHLCQEASHPHTPLRQLQGLQCVPSAAGNRLLELLRAAGGAAEKQKMSQGHGEHDRVQSRAGLGPCRAGTAHSYERCWVWVLPHKPSCGLAASAAHRRSKDVPWGDVHLHLD